MLANWLLHKSRIYKISKKKPVSAPVVEPPEESVIEDPSAPSEDTTIHEIPEKTDMSTIKVKKTSIPKALKELVWKTWAGQSAKKAKCMSCKLIDIKTTTYYCGYVIAETNGVVRLLMI